MKNIVFLILAVLLPVLLVSQVQRDKNPDNQPETTGKSQQDSQARVVKWNLTQGFETYANFTLDFSPWFVFDLDESDTYGFVDYDFPNDYDPMAFIVFNRDETHPPLSDDESLKPHSGNKFAACFSATNPPNDDWIITPLIELGANGEISFWVKSYTDVYGLERFRVGVSTSTPNPSNFTIISPGDYLEAIQEQWDYRSFSLADYAGQNVYVGIQCVSNDAFIFMLDDIEITSEPIGSSILTGKVTDALTGDPIENALVEVAGLSDLTDENGDYSISGVPAGALNANFTASPTNGNSPLVVQFTDLSSEGSLTVTASASGYTTYNNDQVVVPEGETVELQISLSPVLAGGQYRFVLTWGETPKDLDSHLKTPEIEGSTYHIYWYEKGSESSPPYAILDIDDTTSYGPETTTIFQLKQGIYYYYVYNYSETPAITTSKAVVQIFDDNGLLHTLQVPTSGEGLFWNVCTVDGSTGIIDIINQVTNTEPGGKSTLSTGQLPGKPKSPAREILTWEWDFGDGESSTEQSPSHKYLNNGSYNVSLTVSDGTSTNTETKEAYVVVGPAGVDEDEWLSGVTVYPNPTSGVSGFRFQVSDDEHVILKIFDLQGREVAAVIDEMMPAGDHLVRFDANKLEPGIYLYRISTIDNRQSTIGKLVVVR
jgi:PKD repeat protein